MSRPGPTSSAADLIPLAERLQWLWLFRLVAVLVVVGFAAGGEDRLLVEPRHIAYGTAAYLLVQAGVQAAWRRGHTRGLGLFGAVLTCDGLFLAWISYAASLDPGPLRYLSLVHLVVVALLASYRTGVRLALWHSALAFLDFHVRAGSVPGLGPATPPPPDATRELVGFILLFWLVVLTTTTFSSINERELRRRRYDLEALAELARHVEAATSPTEVVEALLDRLVEDFGFSRLVVVRQHGDGPALQAVRGSTGSPVSRHTEHPRSVVDRVSTTGRTLLVAGLDEADAWLAEGLPQAGNLLIIPMKVDGQVTGILVAEHSLVHGSRVERRVVDMVERFTAHTALALENALLLEQVRETAVTDGLTGIANRRHFDASLKRQIGRAIRNQEPVSLLLIDIDNFKRLNDAQGHQAGDDVLRRAAEILRDQARVNDVPARYGGEEFALILAGCAAQEAISIADRLRRAVAAQLPVTVTVGVATFPLHAVREDDLVRAADRALYLGKRSGRDQVVEAAVAAERSSVLAET